jgi:diadenosine tetraphosphate (Ap4A) HIT family hydrolase
MNDANYPWLILVPLQNNLKDIVDLSFDDQIILLKEINFVAEILKKEFECDKLNIANLGNVVSQLHIHVIARKKNDATFPKPVWGNAPALEYCGNNLTKTLEKIQKYFNDVDRKSA